MSIIDSVTIRPILPDELETVAYIRTKGFGGEQEKALEELQTTPRYNFSHIVVAEYKGEVIGTATTFPAKMWLSGVPVQVGAMASISVLPEYRYNSVAGKMIEFSILRMLTEGHALAILFPFSHKYYNKFGFGTIGDLHAYRIKPDNLLAFKEGHKVRAFSPEDLPMMRVMYKGQMTWNNGWFTRANEWWDKIIERAPNIMVFENDDMIEGYYFYDIKKNAKGDRVLHLKEFFAAGGDAYRGLIGYLAAQTEANLIEYLAPPDTLFRHTLRQPIAEGAKNRGWIFNDLCYITPGPMGRIVNLANALTTRFYARHMSGERIIQLSDPLIQTNEEPLRFRVVDGRAETNPAEGRPPHIQTDITTFSQILCGYMKAVDALRLGRMETDEDTCSWLDNVIADSPLYIPGGDWF